MNSKYFQHDVRDDGPLYGYSTYKKFFPKEDVLFDGNNSALIKYRNSVYILFEKNVLQRNFVFETLNILKYSFDGEKENETKMFCVHPTFLKSKIFNPFFVNFNYNQFNDKYKNTHYIEEAISRLTKFEKLVAFL